MIPASDRTCSSIYCGASVSGPIVAGSTGSIRGPAAATSQVGMSLSDCWAISGSSIQNMAVRRTQLPPRRIALVRGNALQFLSPICFRITENDHLSRQARDTRRTDKLNERLCSCGYIMATGVLDATTWMVHELLAAVEGARSIEGGLPLSAAAEPKWYGER